MTTTKIAEKSEQLWVEVTNGKEKFMIAICYGLSDSRSSEEETEEWFYELEKEYAVNVGTPVLIIGDMNAHVGNDADGIPGNTDNINKNGQQFRDLNNRRQLTFMNSTSKCEGLWTRNDPNGTKSAIDLVIANEEMQPLVKKMKIDEEGEWTLTRYRKIQGKQEVKPTDHNTIIVELNLAAQRIIKKKTIWNLKNEESLMKFRSMTENIVMKEKWNTGGDPDEKYNRWQQQLKKVMYTCFKRVTVKSKIGNPEINKAIQEKRKIRREIRKLKKIKEMKEGVILAAMEKALTNKVSTITVMIEEERKKVIESRMEKLVNSNKGSSEIWKIRKNVTRRNEAKLAIDDKDGNLLTDQEEIRTRYVEYYEDLMKSREPDEQLLELIEMKDEKFRMNMEVQRYEDEEMNSPFTLEEIQKVLRESKGGKSPGPDEITSEILKVAGTNLRESLLKMMNWFWKHEVLPKKLTEVTIKSIYKGKGATTDLKNHRGIFIGNSILKTYDSLMSNRVKPQLEAEGYTEYQAGGRCNRSIADHLFVLRSILEHHIYIKKELLMEFLDLVKCFDKLVLQYVMNDMWEAGVRGKIWRNIYITNKSADVTVNTSVGATSKFSITETVKQGSILAAPMAALHTDGVNKMLNQGSGSGVSYGEVRINNLIFQDDILKVAEDKKQLNEANIIYDIFGKLNKMQYHETKSKYMTTGKDEDIKLSGKPMQKAASYKYLGDMITPDGGIKETIQTRKGTIAGMTAELNQILEEMDYVNKFKAVLQFYNGIIVSRLLTNAETWNIITPQNLEELEKLQAMTLKRLLRLPTGTPTNGLRNELGVYTIENQINIKKLMFWHRVMTMKEDKLVKKIMTEQTKQPGNHWYKRVIEIATSLGLPVDVEKIKILSRGQWKKIVSKAILNKENKDLEKWVQTSKKCKDMKPNCQLKEYLNILKPDEAMTILKGRLGMTDVKANYKNKYKDINCKICGKSEDLEHLLNSQCKKCNITSHDTSFNDTFQTAKNYHNILWIQAESPNKNKNNLKNLAMLIVQKLK